MSYLFTSESVSEGHPDKVADQISDALLDEFLARDPQSRVAIETMCTTGQVIVAGEISSSAYVDIHATVRRLINDIGYNRGAYRFDGDSCGILNAIHEQSPDISRGVATQHKEDQGAGDQGMMFGYATNETDSYIPLTLDLAHRLVQELAAIRREAKDFTYYRKGKLTTYLRPDSKSQVTVEYADDGTPLGIDTIVVSTQHDEFIAPMDDTAEARRVAEKAMHEQIEKDVKEVLIPRVVASLPERLRPLFDTLKPEKIYVNPTGNFVLGGPHADTGLTGRKIIVDTYGGRGAHGGGAFSGKDPSKVDRSAAYAARHIAKNIVAAGLADEALVQVSYAIGRPDPVNIFINTYGTNHTGLTDQEMAARIFSSRDADGELLFDLRPAAIEERLQLRRPIYRETAAYGHMGRKPASANKEFFSQYEKEPIRHFVELFTWERLDKVDELKKLFPETAKK